MSCTSCGDNRCEACWTLLFCIILYDTVYVEHWVEHWGFARPVRVKDSIRITYRSTVLHNTLSCGDQLHTSPFLSSQLFVQCTHEYEEREYGVRVHRSGHGLAGLDRDQRPGWAVFEAPVFSRLKLASSLKIGSVILLGEDGRTGYQRMKSANPWHTSWLSHAHFCKEAPERRMVANQRPDLMPPNTSPVPVPSFSYEVVRC